MKGHEWEGVAECAWANKWGDYLGYFWHTFCVLKAGATKREWDRERGGEEEEPLCIHECVCTSSCHLQRAEVKPLISQQLCCQVTCQAIPFECPHPLPPSTTYRTTQRLYDCCAIANSFQAELALNSIMSSWTTVSVSCPRTVPLDHCSTVLIIIAVSLSLSLSVHLFLLILAVTCSRILATAFTLIKAKNVGLCTCNWPTCLTPSDTIQFQPSI